jgi:hypothetical protein
LPGGLIKKNPRRHLLFHDTGRQTAAMLPVFLRSLGMQGEKKSDLRNIAQTIS